jgi:CSLREA domain-containing protein
LRGGTALAKFVLALICVLVVASGTRETAEASHCIITPTLGDVTVNQGLPYARLVRGKETMVKLYLKMPAPVPSCAGAKSAIKIVDGTLTVRNGSTPIGPAVRPLPDAINALVTSSSIMQNQPADPKFIVLGSNLPPSGAGIAGSFTATFSITINYQSKGSATDAFTTTQSVSFTTSKVVEGPTKAIRILAVPMAAPLTSAQASALTSGLTTLSRMYPVQDLTGSGLPRVGVLPTTSGGIRYALNNAGIVNVGATPFCGTSTNYGGIQTQLQAFMTAYNDANTSDNDVDRTVGVIADTLSTPSGTSANCFEGFTVTNTQQSWVRLVPDAQGVPSTTGSLLAMENCHTFSCTTSSTTLHSYFTNADNLAENVDRAFNPLSWSWLSDDRSAMRFTAPGWNNSSTVLEKGDFGYLLCGLGGANTSGCPGATAGTLTGVAAGPTFELDGTTNGLGEASTTIGNSHKSTVAPQTTPDPASTYRFLQKAAPSPTATVLSNLGVPIRSVHSGHGTDQDVGTGDPKAFSFAFPLNAGTQRIELRNGTTLLWARNLTTAPSVTSVSVSTGDGGVEGPVPSLRTLAVKQGSVGSRRAATRVTPVPAAIRALPIGMLAAAVDNPNCVITQDHSISGDTSSLITFDNQSGVTVSIYWLDYQGNRVFYNTLPSGQSYDQQTWITHPWVALDAGGNCLGYTISDQLQKTYVIQPPPSGGGDLLVNSNADPGDGACDETCTLRDAIQASNSTAGADTITFNISGSGVHTITPVHPLPTIDEPVTINGWSQGGSEYTGPPLIELNGATMSADATAEQYESGLTLVGDNNTVRGLAINRFTTAGWGTGIDVRVGSDHNVIEGNFIGTNPTGTGALSNVDGIVVRGDANTIGGTSSSARNVISSSAGTLEPAAPGIGVFIDSGGSGNTIEGNYIGTDAAGTAAIGNEFGVVVYGNANTVGGTTSGAGNVISGNMQRGVQIQGAGATANVVSGNYIGPTATGTSNLGNGGDGVRIFEAAQTSVGGATTSAGNVIVANSGAGIAVFGSSSTGNRITQNSISLNGGLGIDLTLATAPPAIADGVTANDPGDADTGPNDLQNYPAITSATKSGASTRIIGTLDSKANTSFQIDYYANDTCDSSGNGEGQRWIGYSQLTTDGSGHLLIDTESGISGPASVGDWIAATATDPGGNTSEFSVCKQVVSAAPPPEPGFIDVGADATDDLPEQARATFYWDCGGLRYPIKVGVPPASFDTAAGTAHFELHTNTTPNCASDSGLSALSAAQSAEGVGTVSVLVDDGFTQTGFTDVAKAVVQADNQPPVVSFATPTPAPTSAPADGEKPRPGEFLQFEGILVRLAGMDPEDHALTENSLTLTTTIPGAGGPFHGERIPLVPPPDTGWDPGTYDLMARADDGDGHTAMQTITIRILGDADHDGLSANFENGCLSDSDPFTPGLDRDSDGIPNGNELNTAGGPCNAETTYGAIIDFDPDDLQRNSSGTPISVKVKVPFRSVSQIVPSSVKITKIRYVDANGHFAEATLNQPTVSWIASGAEALAKFDRQRFVNALNQRGIKNQTITVEVGGAFSDGKQWAGTDRTNVK